MYAQLPFIGSSTTAMRNELLEILGNFYPQIDQVLFSKEFYHRFIF